MLCADHVTQEEQEERTARSGEAVELSRRAGIMDVRSRWRRAVLASSSRVKPKQGASCEVSKRFAAVATTSNTLG
jgi:hypothetical protein